MAQSGSVPASDSLRDRSLESTEHRLDSPKHGSRLKFKDVLFMCLSIVVGVTSVTYFKAIIDFRQIAPPHVELRPLTDLAWIGVAALCYGGLKKLFHWLLYAPLLRRLEMTDLSKSEVTKQKLTKNLFDGCWYLFMFFFGLVTAYGDPNMPFFYLGSGSWDSLGNSWPLHNFGVRGKLYFIFHLGHHYHNLVHHTATMRHTGNYQELILHHVVTTSTTTFAYMSNFEEYALFTLLSHDISDSILNLAKFCRDMSLPDSLCNPVFLLLILSWFFSRLVLAPQCYWIGSQRLLYWKDPYGPEYQGAWDAVKYAVNLVSAKTLLLILLNMIWLYWLLQMGYKRIKGEKGFTSVHEGERVHHNDKKTK